MAETPHTEAGRALLTIFPLYAERILAIEREAARDAVARLRERDWRSPCTTATPGGWTNDCEHGWDTHESLVLALFDLDTKETP